MEEIKRMSKGIYLGLNSMEDKCRGTKKMSKLEAQIG